MSSPSPNQFPQSSKDSDQAQTSEPIVIRRPNPPKPPIDPPTPTAATPKASKTEPAKAPATPVIATSPPAPDPSPAASDTEPIGEETAANQDFDRRQQPIPPPSEPMQYRAIGLVRGKYVPSAEQFTRGMLVTTDEKNIDSVLLGRVMSLVKNHLDLNTDHLWVVYPRTRQEDGNLHLQIVGVWEPEKLDKSSSEEESETEPAEASNTEPIPATDGYFSVRGEVVYQAQDRQQIIIKIRQAPRKEGEKPKFFKLTLNGNLEKKAVGYFWEIHSQREDQALLIKEAKEISIIRPRKKPFPKRKPGGGGGKKPWKQQRPVRPGTSPGPTQPPRSTPIPRPTKRQQPSSES